MNNAKKDELLDPRYLGEMPLGEEVDGDWEEEQELAKIHQEHMQEVESQRRIRSEWEALEKQSKLRQLTPDEKLSQEFCESEFDGGREALLNDRKVSRGRR